MLSKGRTTLTTSASSCIALACCYMRLEYIAKTRPWTPVRDEPADTRLSPGEQRTAASSRSRPVSSLA